MEQDSVASNEKDLPQRPFGSIRAKLIVSFSLLFVAILVITELVGIIGIPFTPYTGRQGQQKEEAFKSLSLVADLKKERLLYWIEEGRDHTTMVSRSQMMGENVVLLRATMQKFTAAGLKDAGLWALMRREESYRHVLDFLETIRLGHGAYGEIYIVDVETGTIFLSTNEARLGADVSPQPFFSGAQRTRAGYTGDIEIDPDNQRPVFYFSHVIKDKTGEMIAVLVMEVDADDIIKPMLHTGEGLGERGEALLVNQNVVILTSLKHPLADGTTARPLEYQIQAQPAVLAASGEEGIIESDDYRGEPVLAAYRHIRVSSDWGWGMVVKRDEVELFAPLRQDVAYTFSIGLVGILAVIGLTIVVARSLTRPIHSLSQTANRVAKGDFAARAPVTTSDEVGVLARMFNTMIERIQHWHEELEARVQARTAELKAANQELTKEIAERKQVEEQLRFQAQLLDSVRESVVATNLEGHVVYWSKGAEALYGHHAEEVMGKSITFIVEPHEEEEEKERIRQVHKTGSWRGQYVQQRKDGTSFWADTVISLVPDENGQPYGLIGIDRDITKRKWAEEALREYSERLEEMVEERTKELQEAQEKLVRKEKLATLGQLAGSVGHELRNPLGVLSNAAYYLNMILTDADETTQEYLDMISSQVRKSEKIVSDLLDFARVKSVEREEGAVSNLVTQVLEEHPPPEQIEVSTWLAANLPPVFVDHQQINQVLVNLVTNAYQAMPEGGQLTIVAKTDSLFRRRGRGGEGVVFLSITDTGSGIPQKNLKMLFEPLFTTKPRGIGLGLAVSKILVEANGGIIKAESDGVPGQGSTFTVILPTT